MAESSPEETIQEVKEYQYFQPGLIKVIASENIYDEDKSRGQPPWEIDDFEDESYATGLLFAIQHAKPSKLHKVGRSRDCIELPTPRKFRLFVVEDLSRHVIEISGAHYDIEPAFFRDQIFDYARYNTRDRGIDPPRLNVVSKRQRWLQIRFATSRYFHSPAEFLEGCDEVEGFNVFRRPEDDLNNTGIWDAERAIVGLSRTRSAFWLGSAECHLEGAVGILLVDPTIKAGSPLWRGYRNWEETPSMRDIGEKTPSPGPPRNSFFEDLIYWLEKPDIFGPSSMTNPSANVHILIQALFYMICGEWLTIAEYIQTRLAQVEWEIFFPERFLKTGKRIEVSLRKLHIWRRLVPLYHEMLTETLDRTFSFPCHPITGNDTIEPTTLQCANIHGLSLTIISNAAMTRNQCQCPLQLSASSQLGPINALREDFSRLRISMESFQTRIDRLTAVVTASISIDDSHRGLSDTRNVTKLTWLATCFIPLSLTATIFCMQSDIGTLRHTIKWYFLTALLFVCMTIGIAFILTGAKARHRFRNLIRWKQKKS